MIPVGTPCYLVALGNFAHLDGRVVQVVGHAVDDDGIAWHELAAEWLAEVFGNRDVSAQAANLRPIIGPTTRDSTPTSTPRRIGATEH